MSQDAPPTVTAADPPPSRGTRRGPQDELAPVLEALTSSAGSRSEILLSEAGQYALARIDEARREADRILHEAWTDGESSASRTAAMLSASGRRRAH